MKQKDKKISQKIIFLLFSTFFLVGLFTFKDYGISVDEEFHRSSGFYWLNYILGFITLEENGYLNADMNNDNSIDILDVVALVNNILG